MEIKDLPSLQSVFRRMQELESIVKNPAQAVSFPSLLAEEMHRNRKTVSEETPQKQEGITDKEISLPFPDLAAAGTQPGISSQTEKNFRSSSKNNDLMSFIERTAEAKGIDPNLVKAVIKTESGFQKDAVSPKGAMGLMQLMPSTADLLGVDDPMNPRENVVGGVSYLGDMLKKFGDTEKALAAYNAGPGAVKKYNGVPPYKETQDYVEKVKKNYKKFSGSI